MMRYVGVPSCENGTGFDRLSRHYPTTRSRTVSAQYRSAQSSVHHRIVLGTLAVIGTLTSACFSRHVVAEALEADGPGATAVHATVVDDNDIDLGTIDTLGSDGKVTVVFRWENKTGGPLTIQAARGGCPSTTSVSYGDAPIAPGKTADFTVKHMAHGVFGELYFAGIVEFEGDAIPQQEFIVRAFRPQPPAVLPEVVDFGAIGTAPSVRPFAIVATLAPGSKGVTLPSEIHSSHQTVTCKLVDARNIPARRSGKTVSVRAVMRFEARASGGRDHGALEGELLIPLLYNGKRMEVQVPFHGKYDGRFASRPSRLMVFATSAETEHTTSATVHSNEPDQVVSEISVSCSHPSVAASFTPAGDKRALEMGTTLGRVDVRVCLEHSDCFETDIVIRGMSGKEPLKIVVPLKIQVVPNSESFKTAE